jgi:hypothetical protein
MRDDLRARLGLEPLELVVQHVRGRHGAAGAVDPEDHGLDAVVAPGEVELLPNALQKPGFLSLGERRPGVPVGDDACDVQQQDLVAARPGQLDFFVGLDLLRELHLHERAPRQDEEHPCCRYRSDHNTSLQPARIVPDV